LRDVIWLQKSLNRTLTHPGHILAEHHIMVIMLWQIHYTIVHLSFITERPYIIWQTIHYMTIIWQTIHYMTIIWQTIHYMTNNTLTNLILPHFCACSKPEHGFPTSYIVVRFCVQWVKMSGDCLFCWYWWNWSSLFKLIFISIFSSQIACSMRPFIWTDHTGND
jgi:hypothetical protein